MRDVAFQHSQSSSAFASYVHGCRELCAGNVEPTTPVSPDFSQPLICYLFAGPPLCSWLQLCSVIRVQTYVWGEYIVVDFLGCSLVC